MDDIELLTDILDKTGDVIAGVRPDQLDDPTPCPDYDAATLRDHIVGWIQVFEAGCNERVFEGDPTTFHCDDDAEARFRASAAGVVEGWSRFGTDRDVRIQSGDGLPGTMVLNMTLMEYLAHGWDLATATSQPVPYTDAEAADVLERAKVTLPPEYQGEGMAFGAIVPVPEDAPAIDRLVGFLGRTPANA